MTRQIINTSLAPDCFVGQIMGDLRVKGWDLPQIALEADPDQLVLSEEDDAVRVSCQGDCEIRLPHGAALEIEAVHGDAQIKLLDEPLKIGSVHGSLSLRSVAGAAVELVHGDLSAKSITGDLEFQQVLGNVEVRQAEGALDLRDVGGDLDLQNVRRDLHVVSKGDARLQLGTLDGETYLVQAAGDVQISLPAGSGLKLHLVSQGHSIKVRLPEHTETYRQEQVDLEIGGGEISLTVEAGGDVSLTAQDAAWEGASPYMADFSEQIARQVESQIGEQLEEVSRRVKDQMDRLSSDLGKSGFSPEDAQRIVDQAMRASERETTRAQEKMRRAQEKLERKLEEAQRRAGQKARAGERSSWARSRHTWGRHWPAPVTPPTPPTPPAAPDPVSEEERLMILRMLEQKKISLEEAEQLLSALEGNE